MSYSNRLNDLRRLVRSEREDVIDIDIRMSRSELTPEQAEAERERVRRETAALAQMVMGEA
jgi:hypothetical protein